MNDSEVVAEILVDALLLNQTGLWNASNIFGCLHAAGLGLDLLLGSDDFYFYFFACLAVQIVCRPSDQFGLDQSVKVAINKTWPFRVRSLLTAAGASPQSADPHDAIRCLA